MLKCKHNEDCSKYPACGHTCGKSIVAVNGMMMRISNIYSN